MNKRFITSIIIFSIPVIFSIIGYHLLYLDVSIELCIYYSVPCNIFVYMFKDEIEDNGADATFICIAIFASITIEFILAFIIVKHPLNILFCLFCGTAISISIFVASKCWNEKKPLS